jgi:DNA-directed RNA polymerase specialized sigma24 family protein
MIMELGGTITRCMRDLEEADGHRREDAAQGLWEYFFADLVCFARKRIKAMNAPTGPADEEDAAERAFTKVCRAIERGRLKLGHRVDLHKILRTATAREVLNLHYQAKRRSGTTSDEFVLSQIPDSSLPPEALLLALDACQRLLSLLESDSMRRVALWKLAGWNNEAIRVKLGCSLATVERTLARIRETWKREWSDAVPGRPAKSGPRQALPTGSDEFDVWEKTPLDEETTGRILGNMTNFH